MLPSPVQASREGRNVRTPHLDALRIVAAAAVVVLHYAEYTKDHAAAHFVFVHVQHFNMFVDLFFVISGFVITQQYLEKVDTAFGVRRFLWRRVARIYPLHLLTLAFYLAIAAVLQLGLARGENPARYPLSDIPAQLLMLHAVVGGRLTFNFPSWSLSAEMVCYLLFPTLAAVAARQRMLIVILVLAALVGNSLYALATNTGPWTEWINRGGAFRALPSFALGVALYLFRAEVSRWPSVALPLVPVLLAFMLFGSSLPDGLVLATVYAIVMLAVRADLAQQTTLLSQAGIDRWSNLTYSVYMLHIPVATVVLTIAGRYLSAFIPDARLMLVPVALAVLALASYLSYRYVETPLRHFLYALFDRRSEARLALPVTAPRGESR
jgi:peptidoglycan/LPS O-acetylase OafA/YrhL